MNDETLEKYMRAGAIAAEARDTGLEKIKAGKTFLSVVETVEDIIQRYGAHAAFPTNIAINQVAAHYTPLNDDTQIFRSGDVVKLDVGVHIDGYIADTAVTTEVDTDEQSALIQASADALDKAIKHMKHGVSLSSIGEIVEKTITNQGFVPIENLTGHILQRYRLHAGMSIPNVASMNFRKRPKIDDVIAIEPFATDGAGRVRSQGKSNIYIITEGFHVKTIRDRRSRQQMEILKKSFQSLPFSGRWCADKIDLAQLRLQRLTHLGLLHHYPQLIEQNNGLVSQKEHTIIVINDGCQVTTYGKHEA